MALQILLRDGGVFNASHDAVIILGRFGSKTVCGRHPVIKPC